jgi:hypothetical protein
MKMWVCLIARHKSPEARFLVVFPMRLYSIYKYGDDCFNSFTEAFSLVVPEMSGCASLIEEEENQH